MRQSSSHSSKAAAAFPACKARKSANPFPAWRKNSLRGVDKAKYFAVIEKVYGGSAMALVLQALSSGKATKEELDEVRQVLDQMEGK